MRADRVAGGPALLAACALAGVLLGLAAHGSAIPQGSGAAQAPATAVGAAAIQEPPLDTASLATGPFSELQTRYARRFLFLRFNVLDVRVRFGPETADRLRELVEDEDRSRALEDTAALSAAKATDAFAEIEFLRDVRLDQFVDATRENLDRAARAELISEEDAREIGERLPAWFDFLRERGIRQGDRLLYRIRGDTLRTLYVEPDGTVRLDQTDVGPERRLAVLGGYFAPRADFREGLLDSLFAER